jgi:hypothetical protein
MMAKIAASLARQPGFDHKALFYESDTEAYFGRLVKARELSRRAADTALSAGEKGSAADVEPCGRRCSATQRRHAST